LSRFCLTVTLVWLAGGCADPVRDAAVADLGSEAPGVPVGPLHRPGQPCLACHGAGDASAFTVAGTVYAREKSKTPLNDVTVRLIDAAGRRFDSVTNCAGNFFVRPTEFVVQYPLWVTLAVEEHTLDMESPVFREGSCAPCHRDPKGRDSAGPVYFLLDEDQDLPPKHYCP
jgi:hypothetical protein